CLPTPGRSSASGPPVVQSKGQCISCPHGDPPPGGLSQVLPELQGEGAISMSAISTAQATSSRNRAGELIIPPDSHVMEPHDLGSTRLPKALRDVAPTYRAPKVGEGFQAHPGGTDPHERLKEMATDGVSAEVLYPTLGLGQFGLDDATLQEA